MSSHHGKIFSVVLVAAILGANLVFAQSSNVQRAIEGVRDQLDELVAAKDENGLNDLALRIETFKKIIDFSITEAKDLKIKILAIDHEPEEEISDWIESMIDSLNSALEYYAEQKEFIENNENAITLEQIKSIAQEFKDWREENYLPIANQIRDFLLIQEELKAIQVAKNRSQKIGEDLKKLERAKIKRLADLFKLLGQADYLISESERINKEAWEMFFQEYLLPIATETATSTELTAPLEDTSSATSTATSTAVEAIPHLSIKDLVRNSLIKIRETYQVFIEMSNLVRELLK